MNLLNFSALLLPLVSSFVASVLGQHSVPQALQHSRRRAVQLNKRISNVKWSFYDAQTGNRGACGEFINNGEFAVAMNAAQFNQGDCFKTITLRWGGVSRQAVIKDMCPGCPYGGIDLTPGLWRQFAPEGKGIIWDGSWSFGGAPEPSPEPKPTPTPTPTTTWTPPSSTRHSSSARPSSSAHPSSSSAASSSASSSVAASSSFSSGAGPRPTGLPAPDDNLDSLNQIFLRFAQVALDGASAPRDA